MSNCGPRKIVGTSCCVWCCEPIPIYDNSAKSNYPKNCRKHRKMCNYVVGIYTGREATRRRKSYDICVARRFVYTAIFLQQVEKLKDPEDVIRLYRSCNESARTMSDRIKPGKVKEYG